MIQRNKPRAAGLPRPFWIGLLLAFACSLYAQTKEEGSNPSLPGSVKSDVLSRMAGKSALPDAFAGVAYEGAIDRDEYLVGPGDRLLLQVWSPAYEESPLLVSGDGRVAVPFSGPVTVAGKTLNQAEVAIAAEFDLALKRGRISISLLEPRKFRIHVTGEVLIPGSYTVPATARVGDAIELASGFRSVLKPGPFGDSLMTPQVSLRRIQLRSRSGEAVNVDMQRFLQGGDLAGNPYVTDGSVIYVPPLTESHEPTGVYGAVYYEGNYEYAPGDDVYALLNLSGGVTPSSDSSSLVLQRANGERVPLTFGASDLSRKVFPGDRLYVGGKPEMRESGSASIRGQVAKPGGYSIKNGVTTVAELVEQAGGLTSEAAVQSARLIRRKTPDSIEPERHRILMAPGSVTLPEPVSLADKELAIEFLRWDYGTVVLDLSADPEDPDAAEHVTLQDGDLLEIPRQPMGVRVLGYVNHAGEVPWIEGGDLSHYLDAAGGMNRAGWKGRTVIIKARNGSQLRYHKGMEVNPGDMLFVPQRPRTTSWEKFKDVVSVVAQLATLALIIQNTSK